jgi:hypothetical protein
LWFESQLGPTVDVIGPGEDGTGYAILDPKSVFLCHAIWFSHLESNAWKTTMIPIKNQHAMKNMFLRFLSSV